MARLSNLGLTCAFREGSNNDPRVPRVLKFALQAAGCLLKAAPLFIIAVSGYI